MFRESLKCEYQLLGLYIVSSNTEVGDHKKTVKNWTKNTQLCKKKHWNLKANACVNKPHLSSVQSSFLRVPV